MISKIHDNKSCHSNIIISAKGIYRAALLTSIRNFAEFRSSRSCVVVNAFLDVFRNVITRNLRRCLQDSTSVIYYSKLPSVSFLTSCILRILTFLIRRPLPPRMRRVILSVRILQSLPLSLNRASAGGLQTQN